MCVRRLCTTHAVAIPVDAPVTGLSHSDRKLPLSDTDPASETHWMMFWRGTGISAEVLRCYIRFGSCMGSKTAMRALVRPPVSTYVSVCLSYRMSLAL